MWITHLSVWHGSFICVTWLIHMCDMAYSYVRHDCFICVTWLIHMCDMTHVDDSCQCEWLMSVWQDSFVCDIIIPPPVTFGLWHIDTRVNDSCEWLMSVWMTHISWWNQLMWVIHRVTRINVWHWVKRINVWHESFAFTWVIHTDMSPSHWHESFAQQTWVIHMSHSHLSMRVTRINAWQASSTDICHSHWHNSFICVTRLIHMCDTCLWESNVSTRDRHLQLDLSVEDACHALIRVKNSCEFLMSVKNSCEWLMSAYQRVTGVFNWHEPFTLTWAFQTNQCVTRINMWHESFAQQTWVTHMSHSHLSMRVTRINVWHASSTDTSHSHWHESFTWIIHPRIDVYVHNICVYSSHFFTQIFTFFPLMSLCLSRQHTHFNAHTLSLSSLPHCLSPTLSLSHTKSMYAHGQRAGMFTLSRKEHVWGGYD